jgi:dTDP-4-dehydrorhamnose 3,5-epimerase
MIYTDTALPGVKLIDMQPIADERGFFSRFWCRREMQEQGLPFEVAQINTSLNVNAGTVRGLHYQREPHAEAKIVSCTSGSVFDVAVDIRPHSEFYLQWYGVELNPNSNRLLYIPAGFAHGYQALDDNTRLLYLVSEFYKPDAELGLRYDDPQLKIDWPCEVTSVSEKDSQWPLVTES